MQSRACSDTGQPSASASRKISSHSEGRVAGAVGIDEADAVAGDLEVPADAGRGGAFGGRPGGALRAAELAGDARGRAGNTRPSAPRRAAVRSRPSQPMRVGDALLQLVGQHVGVAAGFGVEHAADPQQELLGVAGPVPTARARSASRALAAERLQVAHRRDVAQPARRVLDVGLELIDGAVELRVALLDELQQRVDGADAVLGGRRRATLSSSRSNSSRVAGNRPRVERPPAGTPVLPMSSSSKSASSRT